MRVQYSVFECSLSKKDLDLLIDKLQEYLAEDDGDSIRIYPIPENVTSGMRILGRGEHYSPNQLILV